MWSLDRPITSPGDFGGGGLSTLELVTPGFAATVVAYQTAGSPQARADFSASFPNLSLGDWAIGFGALLLGVVVLREVL